MEGAGEGDVDEVLVGEVGPLAEVVEVVSGRHAPRGGAREVRLEGRLVPAVGHRTVGPHEGTEVLLVGVGLGRGSQSEKAS